MEPNGRANIGFLRRKVGWDYGSASWYFITVNAYAESLPFSEVRNGEMFRNELGEAVARNWLIGAR